MSTMAEIDLKTYGRLLAKTTPVVIKSDEDNERVVGYLEISRNTATGDRADCGNEWFKDLFVGEI